MIELIEQHTLYNPKINQNGTLSLVRYKNGDVKNWQFRSEQGVYIADNKTSILVLIDLFKSWIFYNKEYIKV